MLLNHFKDKIHEQEFKELIEQSEIELLNMEEKDELVKRQIAFLYLIAMYQEDYEHYEGMKFYIEVYEDISIDGPVYLLDDHIKLDAFPHEKMLKVAKDILKGETPDLGELEEDVVDFAKEAVRFAMLTSL